MPLSLDLKGLKCPLPALKTRKALQGMAVGETIEVICTDPMASIDIPHLVTTLGDSLLGQSAQESELRFTIRREER
jgi:tRNA 2-thiouridine synthesizing protein A